MLQFQPSQFLWVCLSNSPEALRNSRYATFRFLMADCCLVDS